MCHIYILTHIIVLEAIQLWCHDAKLNLKSQSRIDNQMIDPVPLKKP